MSDRKYRGSYQAATALLGHFSSNAEEARGAFFDQLALSVLLRNGDAHLKNFGVLYDDESTWLAPLFDVVTTTIYPYERGGVKVTDRTMALRLLTQGERRYPLPDELASFGQGHCHVTDFPQRIGAIAEAMRETLKEARKDDRVPRALLKALSGEWNESLRQFDGASPRRARR